jgi:hypothetical protein
MNRDGITSTRWALITFLKYLGYLVGYLGGPLAPDEAERYRNEQAQQEGVRRTVTV